MKLFLNYSVTELTLFLVLCLDLHSCFVCVAFNILSNFCDNAELFVSADFFVFCLFCHSSQKHNKQPIVIFVCFNHK